MAHLTSLDGNALLRWAERATRELGFRRAEINALNVFPVPDSDTGSNMAHTMEAAIAQAHGMTGSAREVAHALAAGAVRGARGNSGVVLSQVLRGIAQTAGDEITGVEVQNALRTAVDLVDRAISAPVEGTVITVLRAAAQAASAADLWEVSQQAVVAARRALEETPSQLEVLREAGVVDAGGQGLVVLLEALLSEVEQSPGIAPTIEPEASKSAYLEVMFHFTCSTPAQFELAIDNVREFGDSLMVAREHETAATVHIHTRQAGKLIEYIFAVGAVRSLHLEVLPEARNLESERIVIAVVPEGPLTELYEQAGAKVIHPHKGLLYDLIGVAHTADELILLPNGLMSRKALVAAERAAHAAQRTLMIVPSPGLVQGIAAIAVHDPDQAIAVDAYAMSEAASEVRTAALDSADELVPALQEMLSVGGELVTILSSLPVQLEALAHQYPTVDCVVYPASGMGHAIEIGVE